MPATGRLLPVLLALLRPRLHPSPCVRWWHPTSVRQLEQLRKEAKGRDNEGYGLKINCFPSLLTTAYQLLLCCCRIASAARFCSHATCITGSANSAHLLSITRSLLSRSANLLSSHRFLHHLIAFARRQSPCHAARRRGSGETRGESDLSRE